MSESYVIQINALWEQHRFVATMIHNVNVGKKSDMIKPHQLFELPQDNIKRNTAKTSREDFEKYQDLINSKLNKK